MMYPEWNNAEVDFETKEIDLYNDDGKTKILLTTITFEELEHFYNEIKRWS